MSKSKGVLCPVCATQVEMEVRPIYRKKAAYYCSNCGLSLTKEMVKQQKVAVGRTMIEVDIEVTPKSEGVNLRQAIKELLEGSSFSVSGDGCTIEIKNIRL